MKISTFLATLLVSASAYANPPGATDPSNDNMTHFLAEHGFMGRIGEVGNKVETRAAELVLNAMAFLDVPYKRGGSTLDTGFDCSGFVRSIVEQTAGLLLPRRAEQQAAATQKVERTELQPGDLVFFNTMRRTFSHVGIYIGNGKFIHSPKPGTEVRVEDMGLAYWKRRFDGARRVAQESPSTSNP
jgi:cell wall-associated NlpC family hydrolase